MDDIFIRFGTKLYRQVVGTPVDTNCAPLVADFSCFVMMSLSNDKLTDDTDNTTSRYLDGI